MDLFLGRRFLSLGSNILNYVRLRAALSQVLLRMSLQYHSALTIILQWHVVPGVPPSRHVFDGRLWPHRLSFQDLWLVHLAREHREREDLPDSLVRLLDAYYHLLTSAHQVGLRKWKEAIWSKWHNNITRDSVGPRIWVPCNSSDKSLSWWLLSGEFFHIVSFHLSQGTWTRLDVRLGFIGEDQSHTVPLFFITYVYIILKSSHKSD